jgi:PX domain
MHATTLTVDSYDIVVSERVSMKLDKHGNAIQYFTAYAVTDADTSYPKLEKTYQDFKNLELAINNNLRSNDIECPSLENEDREINMSSWQDSGDRDVPLNDKILNVKRFCKKIGVDPVYHCEPFYEFFEIPRLKEYYEGRKSEVDVTERLKSIVNRGNFSEIGGNTWVEFNSENTSDYCPYFRVAVLGSPEELEDQAEPSKGTHNYFNFLIKQLADLDTNLNIKKRYTEFYDLAVIMKPLVTARPPPLPPKLMIKDKVGLLRRGEALEEWLAIMLNEKMFLCPELFTFIGLEPQSLAKYSKIDLIGALLDAAYFKFNLVDRKSQQSSEDSFVTWEILVEVYDSGTKDLIDRYRLFRRFREFDHLNSDLKHKFQKNKRPLPELPGKMAYLNILSLNNKMDQRQEKLHNYLRQLADYPNIFHTVCFRKFIALDTRRIELLINSSSKKRSQL